MKKNTVLIGTLLVLALVVAPALVLTGDNLQMLDRSQSNQEAANPEPLGMQSGFDECTIGVNHYSISTHNRPVLWKVHDVPDTWFKDYPGLCQSVQYYSDSEMQYDFIALVLWLDEWPDGMEDPKAVCMGLNEAGVGTGNSLVSGDIPHLSNYKFQYLILGKFSTMAGIREYIEDTRDDSPAGNFPFIDSAGNASMFELDPSEVEFWEYDTQDPDRVSQGLLGFVVRANEFHKQDDGTDDTSIKGRYLTGTENTLGLINAGEFNEQTVTQSDSAQEYLLIRNREDPWWISNSSSRAATAIQGVAPGENPALATMWALLGNPSFSIAVPTWASVSDIPDPIRTCAMYEAVTTIFNEVKSVSYQDSLTIEEEVQSVIWTAEAHLFKMVNERLLPHWRTLGGAPDVGEMTRIEHQMAWDAYRVVNYLATTGEPNQAPTVDFEAKQLIGSKYKFHPVTADTDGNVATYEWNFGDGETSIKAAPVHDFQGSGIYLVSLTVADDDGVTTTAWRYLSVGVE